MSFDTHLPLVAWIRVVAIATGHSEDALAAVANAFSASRRVRTEYHEAVRWARQADYMLDIDGMGIETWRVVSSQAASMAGDHLAAELREVTT